MQSTGSGGLPACHDETNTPYSFFHSLRHSPPSLPPGNLHEFTAESPCAVLDLLVPPYQPGRGVDCTYYREVAAAGGMVAGAAAGAALGSELRTVGDVTLLEVSRWGCYMCQQSRIVHSPSHLPIIHVWAGRSVLFLSICSTEGEGWDRGIGGTAVRVRPRKRTD